VLAVFVTSCATRSTINFHGIEVGGDKQDAEKFMGDHWEKTPQPHQGIEYRTRYGGFGSFTNAYSSQIEFCDDKVMRVVVKFKRKPGLYNTLLKNMTELYGSFGDAPTDHYPVEYKFFNAKQKTVGDVTLIVREFDHLTVLGSEPQGWIVLAAVHGPTVTAHHEQNER